MKWNLSDTNISFKYQKLYMYNNDAISDNKFDKLLFFGCGMNHSIFRIHKNIF
jgi:hypothetical protein